MKKVLRGTAVFALIVVPLLTITCLLSFAFVKMSSRLGGVAHHALVAKWFHKDKLKAGDLVWVELDDEQSKPFRTIQRIERVDAPDPLERPRAAGRRFFGSS